MISYFNEHHSEILSWLGWHVWLSAIPVVIGLSSPCRSAGWRTATAGPTRRSSASPACSTRSRRSRCSSCCPACSHQVLDPINVVVALTIYTVALLVRVVADGLASVPDDVAQAATAMGYQRFQRLVAVELPIAVPVIAAGLRVATVSNVSLVAVAAMIGVPQLGQLFTDGFQLSSYQAQIVIGIVLCVVLALVFDAVILLLTRSLTPWRRAVQPA